MHEPELATHSEKGVALVTGGAVRVGRAISQGLAAIGYHVVVNYLESASAAAEVVETIQDAGGSATAVRADVTEADDCRELVERSGEWGPVNLLVNNAALFERRSFLELDEDLWQRQQRSLDSFSGRRL